MQVGALECISKREHHSQREAGATHASGKVRGSTIVKEKQEQHMQVGALECISKRKHHSQREAGATHASGSAGKA